MRTSSRNSWRTAQPLSIGSGMESVILVLRLIFSLLLFGLCIWSERSLIKEKRRRRVAEGSLAYLMEELQREQKFQDELMLEEIEDKFEED